MNDYLGPERRSGAAALEARIAALESQCRPDGSNASSKSWQMKHASLRRQPVPYRQCRVTRLENIASRVMRHLL